MYGCDTTEIIKKFHAEHGGDFVILKGWVLFSDGAVREDNSMGLLVAPPSEPYERATNIFLFYKTKLALAVEEFQVFRSDLLRQSKTNLSQKRCPNAYEPDESLEHLKSLQKKVQNWKVKFEAAKKAVEDNKPDWMKKRDDDSYERATNEKFVTEINKIEI
jgi:hypothetical protein